jgi:hypothetical protein
MSALHERTCTFGIEVVSKPRTDPLVQFHGQDNLQSVAHLLADCFNDFESDGVPSILHFIVL